MLLYFYDYSFFFAKDFYDYSHVNLPVYVLLFKY